mmetsp:Transcript_109242/g.216958  ORF Transcript_109242/g.216958 Transcript_109242/m.216958 type:complete len:348 (+) Transcript_109242:122-1165(+)|eukprot:CAMPEP_0172715162 /NCGR_PEP_ID=MMETSP1074-20121228/67385_1 /TAXON_ID=2916 /ORGANISM="Ceratium fusus, Strain PA161109" /LENGTH=347 /DNA_ID=CAMNT_0013539711 /DNA_START=74 /DNA_END=1117 /DNA_ORIENTATION=+
MGNTGGKTTNSFVDAGSNYPQTRTMDGNNVHLIITALDYKNTENPLTCTKDGNNIQKLAAACGLQNIEVMYDEECTTENVVAKIQSIGSQCQQDDFFIFYYSGHGTNMQDQSGDEEDGQDEAFCFVTPDGQISYESCMRDDDFSKCICESVPEATQILILTDCCHSGTIADLDGEQWAGRKAISIAGCLDSQTSGDMGRGGIFTHSMLMAIDNLKRSNEREYSVGALYNATLVEDKRIFNSAQDITIQCTSSVKPDEMQWPMTPVERYQAPLSQAAEAAQQGDTSAPAAGLQDNAELCDALGISPQTLQFLTDTGINALPEDYQNQIKPFVGPCFQIITYLVQQICK